VERAREHGDPAVGAADVRGLRFGRVPRGVDVGEHETEARGEAVAEQTQEQVFVGRGRVALDRDEQLVVLLVARDVAGAALAERQRGARRQQLVAQQRIDHERQARRGDVLGREHELERALAGVGAQREHAAVGVDRARRGKPTIAAPRSSRKVTAAWPCSPAGACSAVARRPRMRARRRPGNE
jgi:hypothetical protein